LIALPEAMAHRNTVKRETAKKEEREGEREREREKQ